MSANAGQSTSHVPWDQAQDVLAELSRLIEAILASLKKENKVIISYQDFIVANAQIKEFFKVHEQVIVLHAEQFVWTALAQDKDFELYATLYFLKGKLQLRKEDLRVYEQLILEHRISKLSTPKSEKQDLRDQQIFSVMKKGFQLLLV